MKRRPSPATSAALGALAVELIAVGLKRPEHTLCPDIRAAFRTHTPAGRAAFVGAWIAFSAWFLPHILTTPEAPQ